MLDLRFVRENPELVKENIRKKFEDNKEKEKEAKIVGLQMDIGAMFYSTYPYP